MTYMNDEYSLKHFLVLFITWTLIQYLRIKIVCNDHIIVNLIVFRVVATLREGVGDVVLSLVPVPPGPRGRQSQL